MLTVRLSGNPVIRVSATLLLLVILFLPSFAQDVPRFYGEEVVVTATRLPQLASKSPWNTSIITAQELKNFRTVGEVLRITAGVDAKANGSLGALDSVKIRGGGNSSQVLILVDGRRINSPTLGMFDMGDILTDNIERIEIVRAPLSAVYGSDAVSGAINIITKFPKEAEKSLLVSYGTSNTQQYKGYFGNDFYSVSINRTRTDGFRINSDYLADNFFGKVNFHIPFGELTAGYNYYSATKGVPGVPTSEADPLSASSPKDRQTDKNTMINLSLKNDNSLIRAYRNNLDNGFTSFVYGAATYETLAYQTGFEWQQNVNSNIGALLYGIEVRQDEGKGDAINGQDRVINNYAIFFQDQSRQNDYLSIIASVRGDKHSIAGSSVNPRLGVVYRPQPDLILRASGGTAFRAPTINDLYWSSVNEFGDANLKPEKNLSYEIALERKISENSDAKLSYFASRTTDLILWDYYTTTEAMAKNIGEVTNNGVEFEFTRKIGDGKGYINYSYQRAIDINDRTAGAIGKFVPYSPQNKLNIGLIFGNSSLIVKHVGERYADNLNAFLLPSYTVVDLKYSKMICNMEIAAEVNNLLNESYSESVGRDNNGVNRGYPMPGRRYSLGVKWAF